MTINYAHRGASGYYPENTMVAFEKAVELGAGGIETDVQMTKDGILVLIHDEKVDRTTNGCGFVKDYTYDELRKLDAGSWFSKEFKGVKIPSLDELIEYVKYKDIILNLELKNNIIKYPNIEEVIISKIHKNDIQDRVIISSFNHYSIVKCKEISKEIRVGLLYGSGLYKPEHYAEFVGVEALHPYFYSLNKEVIEGIKKKGIMINTYTVNEPQYMRKLVLADVDGIITNYPDKLAEVLAQAAEK